MRYYLKKCGHQELGSVGSDGKPQRGRYLLMSMNENILSMFPALSEAQLNDSALLPVIPLYSGKKIYCNYVYHNDKYHGSTAVHPRNEYRIYLNKALEKNTLLYQTGDIIIIRQARNELQEEEDKAYYLDYVKKDESALYQQLQKIIVHPKTASDYLKSFEGRKIRVPENPFFIPDLENIKYHRDHIYGLFLTTGRLQ